MGSTKLMLKMNKKNQQGEVPIYIRIINNRKVQFVSLGIYIDPKYWDDSSKSVRKSHTNYKRFNSYIAEKYASAQSLLCDLDSPSKNFTPKKIKQTLTGKTTDSFIKYAEAYIEKLEKSGKLGTHAKAEAVISKLKKYLNENDLRFDDIDVKFLKQYEEYLRFQKKNSVNTIHSNMKVLRRIINEAIQEEVFPASNNPFFRFKLKWENAEKSFLTEEELETLENFKLVEGSKRFHHRNMYIFAAYSGGIRISDILQLKWENYDGERVLIKTQKTGSVVSIKLPGKALQIINSYKTPESKPTDFVFPFLKNDFDYSNPKVLFNAISSASSYTNSDLKDIAKEAEIGKPLNFHTSRHTWATRALKKGMRIEYVSKLMGHSSIKTTQVYAKIVNADLDKAMEVFDDINTSG